MVRKKFIHGVHELIKRQMSTEEIETDDKVMDGSPETELVLRTCSAPGIKSVSDLSYFIVPEATQSYEIALYS